jgi:hypothetical protein
VKGGFQSAVALFLNNAVAWKLFKEASICFEDILCAKEKSKFKGCRWILSLVVSLAEYSPKRTLHMERRSFYRDTTTR